MNLQKKKEKLLSQVEITTYNGIKMQDTRTKDPNINCGEFCVKFNFTSKEDYLAWRDLYLEIVNDKEFYASIDTLKLTEAPFNIRCFKYLSHGFLFYKIREASKIHAESCYQANKNSVA